MTQTEKKIYARHPEIKEKVFDKYPLPKEKVCRAEKATMNFMRETMALRLFREAGQRQMQFK